MNKMHFYLKPVDVDYKIGDEGPIYQARYQILDEDKKNVVQMGPLMGEIVFVADKVPPMEEEKKFLKGTICAMKIFYPDMVSLPKSVEERLEKYRAFLTPENYNEHLARIADECPEIQVDLLD